MKSIYNDQADYTFPRIMLSPKEAAIALSMSEKGLWNITYPRGDLPAIKAGTRTLYPVHLLRRWANQQWTKQQCATEKGGVENE